MPPSFAAPLPPPTSPLPNSASRSPTPPFLEVDSLLDQSYPQMRPFWSRYSLLLFPIILVASAYISSQAASWAGVTQTVSSLLIVALVIFMFVTLSMTIRGQRREQEQLQSIEEMIQLRRWSEAGLAVQNLLRQPTRTNWGRVQGLIFLSGVLMRYHRFSDAITVHEYLLENLPLDGPTLQSLRLGRAMAMLRDDRLVDADQAINELRKQAIRWKAEQGSGDEEIDAKPQAAEAPIDVVQLRTSGASRTHASSGLALVELYRDVKTGHPAEAIEIFKDKLQLLRTQLGHRVADAYVLAARAYDLLNQTAEAERLYADATLMAPAAELHRRFPETAVMANRYAATIAPLPPATIPEVTPPAVG